MVGTHSSASAAACAVMAAIAIGSACHARPASLSPTDPSTDAGARPLRVLVLGDSLAVSPNLAESFPTVLQARISDLGLNWTMTNAGRAGDTTAGALARVDALLGSDVGVLVLELGANDGLRGIDLSIVEQNLSAIIERAQARGIKVLLCGMETPPLRGWEYSIGFHEVFPRLAAKYRVALVPFLLHGVALDPTMNGVDGIHPNANGARRIAETVWPYLMPLLSTTASR